MNSFNVTGEGVPGDRPAWGVGALLRALADALQAHFNPVRVRGEVSGLTRAGSGHCYFSLKDEQGQLRCAMFRRAAQLSGMDLREGQLIEAQGRLDIYGPRGDLQLIVENVRLAGQGSLFEQFMRLKAELEAQGFFDPARKRPLPALPRSLGVVTSLDAAALRDVVATLRRRAPHLRVTLFPSLVQGDQAPAALCEALDAAYQRHLQHGDGDVLLLVRGGGSLEDLWAFNSPLVVRKLAQAPMPVVSGVGHETDFTLADFVADLRAATPTAAAELCAPSRDALLQGVSQQAERMHQVAWRCLDLQSQRLDRLGQRLGRPSQWLGQEKARLVSAAHRLERGVAMRLDRETQSLARLADVLPQTLQRDVQRRHDALARQTRHLALLDPSLVLQRGYAWLADETGHAITSVHQAQVGQSLQATLADGQLELAVTTART